MAFEPIDTTTHSRAIEAEYLKVVKGDPDTTWLIISPNSKKQYEPELVGTSFSEFLQSFDDTKVQYGLARVSPPGSDVQKLILIGWCPDSAPLKTRASFAQNFGVISNQVFKTYHVQVTARDEDDLDESELLMKISNSAGARYSIQQQTPASKKPISSAAKTAKKPVSVSSRQSEQKEPTPSFPSRRSVSPPKTEKSRGKKDDEWGEPELEERDFDKKPLEPNSSSWKPIGKVDLQKVIAEENSKEDPRLVVSGPNYDKKIDPQSEIAKLKQESKLKRDAEYNKVLGPKSSSSAQSSGNDSDDKVIKGFKNEKSPAQLWAEKKGQKKPSNLENKTQREEFSDSNEEEEAEEEIEEVRSKFESIKTKEIPIIKPSDSSRSRPQASKINSSDSWTKKQNKFGQPLPGLHDQKKEQNDDWSSDEEEQEEEEETPAPSLPVRRNVPPPPESDEEEEEEQEEEEEEEEEEEAPSLPTRRNVPPPPESDEDEEDDDERAFSKSQNTPPSPAPRASKPGKKESGPSAIAEYDYEAGEDNELTFEENERIINIQFVDDDWWLGELESSGEKGLFPSNYVNLEE